MPSLAPRSATLSTTCTRSRFTTRLTPGDPSFPRSRLTTLSSFRPTFRTESRRVRRSPLVRDDVPASAGSESLVRLDPYSCPLVDCTTVRFALVSPLARLASSPPPSSPPEIFCDMTRGPILSYALDRVQQITIIDSSIKEKFPISFAVEASSRLFATKSTSSKLGAMDGMLKFWGNLASVARAVVGATEGLSKAAKVNRSTGELQAFRDGVVPKVPSSQQFLDMLAVERAMVQACRDNQVPNTNFDYVASAAEADFGVHYAFDLLVDHGSLPLDPTLLTGKFFFSSSASRKMARAYLVPSQHPTPPPRTGTARSRSVTLCRQRV